ncbi:MAG: TIGR01777 family oxidoreductase [Methylococcales bacterium]|nr:TIGR01777 family oxidoreductase [Methylococcales bacterium]
MTKVLMTGGTGFLGSVLTNSLLKRGYSVTVLSRDHKTNINALNLKFINTLTDIRDEDHYDILINLAGAPIFDKYWTAKRKELLRESRVSTTLLLLAAIAKMPIKPKLLISGSAIGYYGEQGDNVVTEQTKPHANFSQKLCEDWESSATEATEFGLRVCLIRTGLVIGAGGGFLQRLLLPFKLGLGGRLGSGEQWMSWIHLNDWISIVLSMIDDTSMQGAYNATAPNPVTNTEFTKTLGKCLHRPTPFPVPAFLLKTLLGEMSALLLDSQKVVPNRLLEMGFNFEFNKLPDAINEVIHHS